MSPPCCTKDFSLTIHIIGQDKIISLTVIVKGEEDLGMRRIDELRSEMMSTQNTCHKAQPATSYQLVEHLELLWI